MVSSSSGHSIQRRRRPAQVEDVLTVHVVVLVDVVVVVVVVVVLRAVKSQRGSL